ncbi:hypothetical protein [uncultured Fretibacterium sp.]|uniref:hypothetical protein n=1 Tax=uncultured Fretibacterium sp. TaxID=1678694 RepID=UPI00261A4C12|nr:hypothetical protein [uncultured Fretibacterium sp.]
MRGKRKVLGWLVLTGALAVGTAWAAATVLEVPAGTTNGADFTLTPTDDGGIFNIIRGGGRFEGAVKGESGKARMLQLTATGSSPLVVAPGVQKSIEGDTGNGNFQLLVSSDAGRKVVVRGSNGDNSSEEEYRTHYSGGTLICGGVLSAANDALGQRWVGILSAPSSTNAPALATDGPLPLTLGSAEAIAQPLLLFVASGDAGDDRLTYGIIDTPDQQELLLRHGLGQRQVKLPSAKAVGDDLAKLEAFDNDFYGSPSGKGFVRLVKTGKGTLTIDSDVRTPNLAAAEDKGLEARALDGAHHLGGTDVREGSLVIRGGEFKVPGDHFRGSLGRVWASFLGSGSLADTEPFSQGRLREKALHTESNYVFYHFYNPLWIRKGASVAVDRSQIFSQLNTEAGSTFEAKSYAVGGQLHYPYVVVTLDGNDSHVNGVLKGAFHLVLDSRIGKRHPKGFTFQDENDLQLSSGRNSTLFLNNPDNEIFAEGETLVANGVLGLTGTGSIGGGKVTVGAIKEDDGFETGGGATLLASKSLEVAGKTEVKYGGMLAAERGQVLSFKDIAINMLKKMPNGKIMSGTFMINPTSPSASQDWSGTVEFGGEGRRFSWTNPLNIQVRNGELRLSSLPEKTASGNEPLVNINIGAGARELVRTFSLGKGARDLSKNVNLSLGKYSRIGVVPNDGDVAGTRAEAAGRDPIFKAKTIDYYYLNGDGPRLTIQLDPAQLSARTLKKGWVPLIGSVEAKEWKKLRAKDKTTGKDFAKVRVSWLNSSKDIVPGNAASEDAGARVHLDDDKFTILLEVLEDFKAPEKPDPQPNPNPNPNPGPNPQPNPNPGPSPKPQNPAPDKPKDPSPGKPDNPSPDKPRPDEPTNPDDNAVPKDPEQWEITVGEPDAAGNVPVKLATRISLSKPLVAGSLKADTTGFVPGTLTVEALRNATVAFMEELDAESLDWTVSTQALSYELRVAGKVAKGQWDTASIRSIRCRLEGVEGERTIGLGNQGLLLKSMKKQKPEVKPEDRKTSGSGGCDAGFGGLLLLSAAALVRRKRCR